MTSKIERFSCPGARLRPNMSFIFLVQCLFLLLWGEVTCLIYFPASDNSFISKIRHITKVSLNCGRFVGEFCHTTFVTESSLSRSIYRVLDYSPTSQDVLVSLSVFLITLWAPPVTYGLDSS
ncbi:hypothetical protein TNIN_227911 [Trichonephila inaurata madagascariensis]|uniref:Uncharacterized protein n=1 Tax=Trichonephila inaurata madagascariensis TaxID=2747483 RepID=A0A8X7CRC2_9ARAC|nr:hypothetical protein TNIN_227911 [Trichonephila inaurata madagascariensis]